MIMRLTITPESNIDMYQNVISNKKIKDVYLDWEHKIVVKNRNGQKPEIKQVQDISVYDDHVLIKNEEYVILGSLSKMNF